MCLAMLEATITCTMSLTAEDLQTFRTILREETGKAIHEELPDFLHRELSKIVHDEVPNLVHQGLNKVVRTEVRSIVHDELSAELAPVERKLTSIERRFNSLDGRATALENDVKSIYFMLSKLEKNSVFTSKAFRKLTLEAKLVRVNADLLAAAKEAGITLPRT